MKNRRYQKIIDKYIANNLSDTEKKEFDRLRLEVPSFAKEVEFEKELLDSISDEDMIDYRRQLKVINDEERMAVKKSTDYLRRTLKYAASISLIVAIAGTLYFTVPYFSSNQRVFDTYYTTEPANISRSSNVNLVEAIKYYQQENYLKAIEYFKDIAKEDESNIAVRFYLGISYIETKKYKNAIDVFEYIVSHRDNLYVEHAEWYIGLCYLDDNMPEKAINQFTIIANNKESVYRNKAREIIKKIKRKKN